MSFKFFPVAAGVWLASVAAMGQSFPPVRADLINQIWQIHADGRRELKTNQTGYFLRSSSGTELRRLKSTKDKGELRDLGARRHYTIDYLRRVAFVRNIIPADAPMSFRQVTPPLSGQILGEELVSGIRCIKITGKDQTSHNLTFVSLEYDLLVRSELQITTPLGERFLVVNGLTNIQLGTEPEPLELSIPEGFRLFGR